MNENKKLVTIIVEASPHAWPKSVITYSEVVALEFPQYSPSSEITYSVAFERGHGQKPEGTLSPDSEVKVKEGMIFHVSETGQS